jgi:hypothetical protein
MWHFWQGNHQVYGHTRCIHGIFGREITIHTVIYGVYVVFSGREITKYTVIHGVYTVNLAGKSPYIRSYTVCVYTVLANPMHT